ncbi:MAG: serine hydrolase domain-containing protein [Limisphaerales bacterium]
MEFTNRNGAVVIGLLDRGGRQVFAKGKLDNGSNAKADASTIFEIGSITKVFTALLALHMPRRGEWNLDDPVARHLPHPIRLPITIGNLADRIPVCQPLESNCLLNNVGDLPSAITPMAARPKTSTSTRWFRLDRCYPQQMTSSNPRTLSLVRRKFLASN